MDGTPCGRQNCPLAGSLEPNGVHHTGVGRAETLKVLRILAEADDGEWRMAAWADELGITVDEMLIELDRHLHRNPPAA